MRNNFVGRTQSSIARIGTDAVRVKTFAKLIHVSAVDD